MKRFLILMVMVCLVILLGFPKPVSASNLEYTYSSIKRNHQAIGSAIPGLHTLEPLSYSSPVYNTYQFPRDCEGTTWFSDKTITGKYQNGSGSCPSLQRLAWYISPYSNRGSKTTSIVLNGYTYNAEIKGLIRETKESGYEEKYLGRYFAQQYPEFAIFGASELRKNFMYKNYLDLNSDYYSGTTKGQKFAVDGSTAVVWEQQIPSSSISNALPTIHHVLIVENSSISDIDLSPHMSYQFHKNANYQYPKVFPPHVLRDKIRDRKTPMPDEVSLFNSFYYLIFATDAPLTNKNIIENVVHSITTGTAPTPYSPSPTVNSSFSFPTLKVGQTTNLPIDVSTAFNPSSNSWTYTVSDPDLPSGLTFDPTTKSIIADPSALPPPGPKSDGSFSVKITVDDHNGHVVNSSFNLTVNP
ncbi:MAG: putative Ig domain-containing protein [Microcoleaceae cyanobacterium]